MAAANDLRRGMAIKYNGNPAIVLEVHHRTPGNLRAFVQAIIRYINTGKSADVRFGSTDKVELVEIERKALEFSYKDRNGYHFMEPETYDTITLQENLIGDAKDYLVENLSLEVLYAEGKPVQVELPASVGLKVVESTSRCSSKKAKRLRSTPAPAPTWAGRDRPYRYCGATAPVAGAGGRSACSAIHPSNPRGSILLLSTCMDSTFARHGVRVIFG